MLEDIYLLITKLSSRQGLKMEEWIEYQLQPILLRQLIVGRVFLRRLGLWNKNFTCLCGHL